MKKCVRVLAFSVGILWTGMVFAEPTIDQIYEATRSGQVTQAQQMMSEVLQRHPNSAKAHYVDAEVLVRSGDLAGARTELALAEKLQPGLPFAPAEGVAALRRELSGQTGMPASINHTQASPGLSWGWILIIGGVGLFLLTALLRRRQMASPTVMPGAMGGPGYYPGSMGPGQPMAPMGGAGSGIFGSLATGAALGAGMVAGEALAHRLVDGPNESSGGIPNAGQPGVFGGDLGGQDFGVGNGSWDSGSSDGGWSGGDSGSDWT